MSGIKLSPKHGVNPTMAICFWCGKPKGDIALLGKLPKDQEAPRYAVIDYDPCEECSKLFSQGIHVIGVTEKPMVENMFPMVQDKDVTLYPTGSMFVARTEWAERFLTANDKADMIPGVLEKKVLLLPDELVNDIIQDSKEVEEMAVDVPGAAAEGEQTNEDN